MNNLNSKDKNYIKYFNTIVSFIEKNKHNNFIAFITDNKSSVTIINALIIYVTKNDKAIWLEHIFKRCYNITTSKTIEICLTELEKSIINIDNIRKMNIFYMLSRNDIFDKFIKEEYFTKFSDFFKNNEKKLIKSDSIFFSLIKLTRGLSINNNKEGKVILYNICDIYSKERKISFNIIYLYAEKLFY